MADVSRAICASMPSLASKSCPFGRWKWRNDSSASAASNTYGARTTVAA